MEKTSCRATDVSGTVMTAEEPCEISQADSGNSSASGSASDSAVGAAKPATTVADLKEALSGLVGLQLKIRQFVSTDEWRDWQRNIHVDDADATAAPTPISAAASPITETTNNRNDTNEPATDTTLEGSIGVIQTLLLDTTQRCIKMAESSEASSQARQANLSQCQADMERLRKDLDFTHRCVNDLETNLAVGGSATESDMEPHAIERELEITVYRLREENGRLREQVKGFQREVVLLRTQQLTNQMYALDSEGCSENGYISGDRNGSNGVMSDDNLVNKIALLEAELNQSKEALTAMKNDRKRLKGEKCELLNQMKEVYQTLEGKERELRDFIRQYEQRMRDTDRGIQDLMGEKDRTDQEKKKLTISLLETNHSLSSLKQNLNAKETENAQLMNHLKELQGRFYLLTGQNLNGNGTHQINLKTPSMGYASLPVSPDVPQSHANRNATQDVRPPYQSPSCQHQPSQTHSNRALTTEPTSTADIKTYIDLPTMRNKSRGRSPKPKTTDKANRLSRLFHLGGSRSKSQTKDNARTANPDDVADEGGADQHTIPDDPITADLNRIDMADRLIEARKLPMLDWKQSHIQAWLELELGLAADQRAAFARNVKSGRVLLSTTESDFSSVLKVTEPLHKKKLRLGIEEYRVPNLCKYPAIREVSWQYVTSHLLPACGLPQYIDAFRSQLVDGRVLNQLTRKQLEKYLGMTNKFHQNSVLKAVELLRLFKFDIKALYKRRSETENARPYADLIVWTNQRFTRWLEHIDLGEYTSAASQSGVCGAVMVLDGSFTVDTLAGVLGIGAKPMVRKHLSGEFAPLLAESRTRLSNEENRRLVSVGGGGGRRPRESSSLGRSFARSCSPGTVLDQRTTAGRQTADCTPKRRGIRGSFGKVFGLKGRRTDNSPSTHFLAESKSMNDSVLSAVMKEASLSTSVIDNNNSGTMSSETSDLGSSIERSEHMKTILGTSQVLKQAPMTASQTTTAMTPRRCGGDGGRETSPISCGVTVKLRSKSASNHLLLYTNGGVRPHSVHDFNAPHYATAAPAAGHHAQPMPSTNPHARRHMVTVSSYETNLPSYVSPVHYGPTIASTADGLPMIDSSRSATSDHASVDSAATNRPLNVHQASTAHQTHYHYASSSVVFPSAAGRDDAAAATETADESPASDHRNMQTISEQTEPDTDTDGHGAYPVSGHSQRQYGPRWTTTSDELWSAAASRGDRPSSLSIKSLLGDARAPQHHHRQPRKAHETHL